MEIIIIETLYLLFIVVPALFIFLKTFNIYKFSRYKGLKYFSYAFLYLALGFFVRYIVMISKIIQGNLQTISRFDYFTMTMEFLLVLAGLFFFYSMVWQNFEKKHFNKNNISLAVIYLIGFAIAIGDSILREFILMYSSQIILFFMASVISLIKYFKKKNNFLQMYFVSMTLFMIVWIINLIAQYTIDDVPVIRLYAYFFTVAANLIILVITFKLTPKKKKKRKEKDLRSSMISWIQ